MQVSALKSSKLFAHLELCERSIEARDIILKYQDKSPDQLSDVVKKKLRAALITLRRFIEHLEGQGYDGLLTEFDQLNLLMADVRCAV